MKILMENWRGFLSEEVSAPKVIFMAGAPGSGKSTVIDKLGLNALEVINPDDFYEPALEKAGLGKNVAKLKEDFLEARQDFKDLLSEILQISEPEDGWKHDVLMEMYESAMNESNGDRTFIHNLETTKKAYEVEREKIVQQAQLFNQARNAAKEQQLAAAQDGRSFVVDGTGGRFAVIRNQKQALEEQGYDVGMIFVDIPLDTAINRQQVRLKSGGRSIDSAAIEKSWNAVNKNLGPYAELFGDNFFHITSTEDDMEGSIDAARSQISMFFAGEQLNEADWQKYVRSKYKTWLKRLTHQGGNQNSGPFKEKAPIDYRGSAPPDAPGG